MSKGRLAKIKKESTDYYDSITLNQKDFMWLIEQVENSIPITEHNKILLEYKVQNKQLKERVEELEVRTVSKTFHEDWHDHYKNRVIELNIQNKRYRETIKEILDNKISCWEVIENKLNYALKE